MKDGSQKPTPRLRHVKPGQTVILAHEEEKRTLLSVDKKYGYFEGLKACLCTEVKPELMKFGGGQGWRVKNEIIG